MDEQEFDLRQVLGVLRRKWRLIALTFFIVVGGATLLLFALKPAYTASALILIDPSDKNLLDPSTQAANSAADSARVDSEVQIVTAETTLVRVVDDAKLLDDPEFGVQQPLQERIMILLRLADPKTATEKQKRDAALFKLKSAVRVFRNGLTYLITVSATADDPESAALVANTLARSYIRVQLESKIASTLSARDIIQDRVSDASNAVITSEESLDKFIASSIDNIVSQTGRTDLAQMQTELESLGQSRTQMQTVADLARNSLDVGDWATLSDALKSQSVSDLQRRQAELQGRIATAGAGSQSEIDLRAELAAVVSDIGVAANSEISRLRQEIALNQARATDMQVQLRTAIFNSDLPPAILTNIYELQQTSELARSQYQTMLTRLKELEAQAFLQVADSRVVSPASAPNNPSFPDVNLLLALAGVLGLVIGVALAFLRENFVGGFNSDVQLASVLKVPVVSSIPFQRLSDIPASHSPSTSLSDLLIASPFSAFSEGIRRLQVGVDQAVRRAYGGNWPDAAAVIMITSANANEGKTTTSLSLARAYALSGRRTILIDCDLRKPSVHTHLGLPPSQRLQEHLSDITGDVNLDSILVNDKQTKAQIVVGGRRSQSQGGQVVTGEFFGRLIEKARSSFEVVILDTPPVGAVVDALHLAQFADVVVCVTRYAITSQQDALATVNSLADAKRDDVEILAVLDGVAQSRRSNKKKYGDYYYHSNA